MATNEYNFQYVPLNGKLPGEVMVQQTQDAINDLGNRVISGAEADAAEALEKADNAVNASAEAVETANNAETIAQEALDYITEDFPKVHFVGVKSTATSDSNYTGGGATGTDSIAIGVTASATNTNSVAIGTGSVASGANEVSVGNDNTKRKIVNVQEGSSNNDVMIYGQGVDRTSAQTISGVKTFSAVPVISGAISADDNSTKIATTAWVNQRIGTGVVASGNTGLINGDTAYAELRPTTEGTWIKTAQTTAQNLEALEGGLEYSYAILSRQYDALKKYVNGNYYDYDTDDDVAYTKTVPTGAMPYASLDKVGGKTLVFNQLVDSGTATVSTISGHKYYTLLDGTASIITSSGSAITIVDDTADMVCDLTLMYGSGNEPSVVSDFTNVFPASYYSYNAGTLLSAGVTSVVSKDSTDTEIATYPIPAAVQALDSYGASTRTKYNYIDYERKVFVQKVKYVDLGSINWNYNANFGGYGAFYSSDVVLSEVNDHNIADIICGKYPVVSRNTLYGSPNDAICLTGSGGTRYFTIRDADYTDAATFKSAMSGTYACGVLKNPVETDISAYLTDDNLIEVEAGGTLTCPNSNGSDYQLPVPSEETYMIDLSNA